MYDLGIDVGTSFTAAAVHRADGVVEVAGLGPIADNIPTVVYFGDDGTTVVGDAANRRAALDPSGAAREFKRRLGDPTPIILRSSPFSPEALVARVLEHVVRRVAERERGEARRTLVTYPANWGPYKQELFLQAIRIANVERATTLPEPVAAALAYSAEARVATGSVTAVYDLGGGTFDAAVLRKTEEGFELLGDSTGIEHLGGVDFDEAVFQHVRQAVGDAWPSGPADPSLVAAVQALRRSCVEAKELLSSETDVQVPVLLPGADTSVTLTRAQFERMIEPRIADTVGSLEAALASARIGDDDLSAVLLVGGSSRIPLVADMLRARFGSIVAVDVDPLYAVARGAAIEAGRQGRVEAAAAAPAGTPPASTMAAAPSSAPVTRQIPLPTAPAAFPPAAPAPAPAAPAAAAPAPAVSSPTGPPAPQRVAAPVAAPGDHAGRGSGSLPADDEPVPLVAAGRPAAEAAPPATAPPAAPVPGAAPADRSWEPSGDASGAVAPPHLPDQATAAVAPPPTQPPFPVGPAHEPFGRAKRQRRRPRGRVLLLPLLVVVVVAGLVVAYVVRQTGDSSSGGGAGAAAPTTVAPVGKASGQGMVAIPAGTYPIGKDNPDLAGDAESSKRMVDVAAYSIDTFEVTNEHYAAFVAKTNAPPPVAWPGGRAPTDQPQNPVQGVTYDWAAAFCASLGKRLPTEIEWEVAARGGTDQLYPWGNDPAAGQLPPQGTYAVGSVATNKSPMGVFDMAGNAWEWVADSYDTNRVKPTERVLRGGQNGYVRSNVTRLPVDPVASSAAKVAGFRCAATSVDPAAPPWEFAPVTPPAALAAASTTTLPAGVKNVDDFRDPTTGWVESSDGKTKVGYHPNRFYHLETDAPNQTVSPRAPYAYGPEVPIEVTVQAEVVPDLTNPRTGFEYGLFVRGDDQGRGLTFSVNRATSPTSWHIVIRHSDGTTEEVDHNDFTIADPVRLSIRAKGDDFSFLIGGTVVTTKHLPGLGGNKLGLYLFSGPDSKKVHIHFSDFEVKDA